jgi:hypothetical protein
MFWGLPRRSNDKRGKASNLDQVHKYQQKLVCAHQQLQEFGGPWTYIKLRYGLVSEGVHLF